MATCEECLHNFVCWKSMQVEKDNLPCSDFADRSLYVVRKKGEWVPVLNGRGQQCEEEIYASVWRCPVCGEENFHSNFCPDCGADMRVEEQLQKDGEDK